MTLAAKLRWVSATILTLLLLTLAIVGYVIYSFVYPDESKFGTIPDEALAANVQCKPLQKSKECAFTKPMPKEDYFAQMDRGYDAQSVWHNDALLEEKLKAIPLLGSEGEPMSVAELRKRMSAGRNTWLVWTGGNDYFWDNMASEYAFGNFDLLKILSSHPQQYYGRNRPADGAAERNRWYYLGLVNEPCFTAPLGPDPSRFGLWLDQRVEGGDCKPDPFANAEDYPGVKTGARGTMVTYQNKKVKLPVGSYYGEPSGVVGLRLFPNPEFDDKAARKWDAERYYTDSSYYANRDLVRPYRVGMSCGFCHVGPSPVNPPADPENPKWANLTSNPGAQYFWTNRIFMWNTARRGRGTAFSANETSFIYQWFHTNPPGTLDTSLVSTDYINNPRTMNAVYSVDARLAPALKWGSETLVGDGKLNTQFNEFPETKKLDAFWDKKTSTVKTVRVLKDGSDSAGILAALNRVYLNIGLFSEEWVQHFFPVVGGREISPILIESARKQSSYWNATERKTLDMALFFLMAAVPDRLSDVVSAKDTATPEYKPKQDYSATQAGEPKQPYPQAQAYQPKQDYPAKQESEKWVDSSLLTQGNQIFAENCAACHSSKVPTLPPEVIAGCEGGGSGPHYRVCWDKYWHWAQSGEFKAEMLKIAMQPDFSDDNFFSTERRVPVDVLGTNGCSPVATNALEGDIWDSFSSATYKQLPAVKALEVHYPYPSGYAERNDEGEIEYKKSKMWQPLGNGRGYTRPASLVSLWSSAPFLLNNSVGYKDWIGAPDYESYYYDPSVAGRLMLFEDSIRKMLNPETRRKDAVLGNAVPGYIFRTTAPSCLKVARGQLPFAGFLDTFSGPLHWLLPWAITPDGDVAVGPFPKDFPPYLINNLKILQDHDEQGSVAHAMKLGRLGLDLLGVFKSLGGRCSYDELSNVGNQLRSEEIFANSGVVDSLLALSKCPDFIVNRGHTFGSELSKEQKQALIEYLKTI